MRATFSNAELELFAELLASDVEFAVTGGAAVNLHGHDRERSDLDIIFNPEAGNLDKLHGVKIGTHTLSQRDIHVFKEGEGAIQSIPGFDLLKETKSVPIADIFSGKVLKSVDGMDIPVISRDHLIREKTCAGNDIDRLDVDALNSGTESN
ncbi:MAG: hypothetical protein HRU33_09570 [Rhodobacteraceae bacterium]|nr:hypothetical protein [Paracoccaceae bacterium]